VRVIWAYAAKVDMSAFEAAVRAREGTTGMPQTSPYLLLALWLYATTDGIGSARALARACESVSAYRWLCGDVGVNHRILSEFRNDQGARIEQLLCGHVASLSAAGLINLDEVAQDGIRIRASAGAASFRRRKTLESELAKAKALLERLSKQDDDGPWSGRRQRAARERAERVEQALANLGEVEKPREGDTPPVARWRARMASQQGKDVYKRRSVCELVHAKLRNRGIDRLYVRGRDKVETWMRWFALAANILTAQRLANA
jgi:transposase